MCDNHTDVYLRVVVKHGTHTMVHFMVYFMVYHENFTDQTGDCVYTKSWTLIYIYQTGHNMGLFTRNQFGYILSIRDSFVYE